VTVQAQFTQPARAAIASEALNDVLNLEDWGRVAQLVEQCPFKAWVAGSSPAALTKAFGILHSLQTQKPPVGGLWCWVPSLQQLLVPCDHPEVSVFIVRPRGIVQSILAPLLDVVL
jgi:hypothetical protein